MKYYAIIVGGGSGKRMQNVVPKQFLLLNDRPVLMHTISAFDSCDHKPEIILVLSAQLQEIWLELCINHNFSIPHSVITGGEQRFHSVRNGLMAIKGNAIVAIHDAVRPLITKNLISETFDAAEYKGNAVPCLKPSDSMRQIVQPTGSKIIDREKVVLIQTPQTFVIDQLRTAYKQPYNDNFTDDASVVERAGFEINLIAGERNNFKITYPEDLELANLLIR